MNHTVKLLTFAAFGFSAWNLHADSPPPNLLLILVDDMGFGEPGCYREDIAASDSPTPNIDRLAATGVRMTAGYVTASICSPARAAIVTGRYQQRFGMYGNPDASVGMPEDVNMMADYLSPYGYSCGWIGKSHLGWDMHPLDRRFDRFYGFLGGWHDYYQPDLGHTWEEGAGEDWVLDDRDPVDRFRYLTYEFTDQALNFIEENERRHRPWALYLPYNALHSPMQAPWDTVKHRGGEEITPHQLYLAMLDAQDHSIGRLIDHLESLEARGNTLIVFLSDGGGRNNEPFRGGKGTLYEGGIRIPYILSMPGRLPEGVVYSRPVSSLDILPTFFSLAGVSEGVELLDGVNLMPYLQGSREGNPRDTLYWQYAQFDAQTPIRFAVRHGDWKLLRETKDLELYDLASDEGERANKADQQPGIVKELWEKYERWQEKNVPPLVPPGDREPPWVLQLKQEHGPDWREARRQEYERHNQVGFEIMRQRWAEERGSKE